MVEASNSEALLVLALVLASDSESKAVSTDRGSETGYLLLWGTGFIAESQSGYLISDFVFFETPEIFVIQK